jgi:hypothetical protein
MLGYTPPEPRLWKAYLAVLPFLAMIVWAASTFIRAQQVLIVICGLVVWPIIAYAVHMRVIDDWRLNYGVLANPYAQTTPLSKINEKPRD